MSTISYTTTPRSDASGNSDRVTSEDFHVAQRNGSHHQNLSLPVNSRLSVMPKLGSFGVRSVAQSPNVLRDDSIAGQRTTHKRTSPRPEQETLDGSHSETAMELSEDSELEEPQAKRPKATRELSAPPQAGAYVGHHKFHPDLRVFTRYYKHGTVNSRVYKQGCSIELIKQFSSFFSANKGQTPIDDIVFDMKIFHQYSANMQSLSDQDKKKHIKEYLRNMGLEPALPDEDDGEIGVFRGSDDRESKARNRKTLVPDEVDSDDADAEEDDLSEQVDRARRVFPVKSSYQLRKRDAPTVPDGSRRSQREQIFEFEEPSPKPTSKQTGSTAPKTAITKPKQRTAAINASQDVKQHMVEIRNLEETIRDQAETIDQLQDLVKQLQAPKDVARPRGDRPSINERVIGHKMYKLIEIGQNRGKYKTKEWSKVSEGGKSYREWIVLDEMKMHTDHKGHAKVQKIGAMEFVKIPDGRQKDLLVQVLGEQSVLKHEEGTFVKWTIRKEIKEDEELTI